MYIVTIVFYCLNFMMSFIGGKERSQRHQVHLKFCVAAFGSVTYYECEYNQRSSFCMLALLLSCRRVDHVGIHMNDIIMLKFSFLLNAEPICYVRY